MSIRVLDGATPSIGYELEMRNRWMNYYVLRPDLTPYEGIKVTKDTKLEFSNDKVKQKVENLELIVESKIEDKKYVSETKMTIFLKEGDILLFERENRGYFLPIDSIGTVDTAIKDLQALALALDGDENDTNRDEKTSS